jgi:hypothetical protein
LSGIAPSSLFLYLKDRIENQSSFCSPHTQQTCFYRPMQNASNCFTMNNFSRNANRTQVATLTHTAGEVASDTSKKVNKIPTEREMIKKVGSILDKTIEQKEFNISESLTARINAILEKSII